MSILFRYILRQLAVTLVLGTTALVGLLWLLHSLRFFDGFINKDLPVGIFLKLSLLMMPGFLTFFLPIALFATILFVYHRMALDRELIVLHTAGLGAWRIGAPALGLAALLTGVGYVLTLHVVPRMEQEFNQLRFEIRHEISRLAISEGAFTEVEDGITIYVRDIVDSHQLEGLILHDASDPDVEVTITASRGALVYDDGQPRVMMVNGMRQERDKANGRVSFLYFDNHTVPLGEEEAAAVARIPETRELPTSQLLTLQVGDRVAPHSTQTFEPRNVRRMRMEAHERLAKPIAMLSFTVLALGALFAGEYNRHGRNWRISASVVLVVLAQASVLGATHLARTDTIYLPLLYVGPVVAGLIGLWWLRALSRQHRPAASVRERTDLGDDRGVPDAPTAA